VGSREEMVALAWEMELVTPKDIRLYNKKKERLPLPEWVALKRKCDRFYFECVNFMPDIPVLIRKGSLLVIIIFRLGE